MGAACSSSLKQIKHKNASPSSTRASNDSGSKTNAMSILSPGSVIFDPTSSESRASSAATRSTLHQSPELLARYKRVMSGDLEQSLTARAKIIRIFTSSTFTDMAAERNALMERIYPKLKEFAQEKGYEFQVVDMRWGVRDESTNDHSTLELCLKELKACQDLSTGPNFMAFLGQKYGFRPIPSKIPLKEFEELLSQMKDKEEKALLEKWFKCDMNAVPPMYVLQPISYHIPNSLCHDADQRKVALQNWSQVFSQIQDILRREAKKLHGAASIGELHKYFMSVTESEIRSGVLCGPNPDENCLWINRNIQDLEYNLQSENAHYFIDIKYDTKEIDTDAQEMLQHLKDVVTLAVPALNIRRFEVDWNSEGISPSTIPEHEEYINNLCREVEYLMKEKIIHSINKRIREDVSDPLYEEVVQHLKFCQTKCETFYGRKEILDRCKAYLQDDRCDPLVIHGRSGCGKTSVVSMAAKEVWNCFSQSNIVIRYIGTTPNSSQVRLLLYSVCQQICFIYGRDPTKIRQDMKELQEDFITCLSFANSDEPLFVFLDSLDQFGPEDNARQLTWLPTVLPDHVKLVVSTLPDGQYECFPILESLLKEENFIEVPKLPEEDAFQILNNWLNGGGRILSSNQEVIVKESLQKCSLPIFIRVAFDEALRWKSYSSPSETVLQDTVRGAVNALFERIELQHGRVLVRQALAYITAAKSGLTGTEIEDLLSCDDRVLDDVYQYWTPPIRRIPPLLWVRIRSDLAGYLVDRGADGASVITWYHRQFIEAARARYLSEEEERTFTHQALGEYFLGVWTNGKRKPYQTSKGQVLEADRFVSHQPWTFEGNKKSKNFNFRKINELPYHLVLCNNVEALKREVLCNFTFLLTCLESSSLRDLMDDFDFALEKIVDDDIQLVKETLQLSTFALLQHPAQLATQLLGRIKTSESNYVKALLDQARYPWQPCLLPTSVCLTSPGGPLVHSMSGQLKPSSAISASADGKLIASASVDTTCSVWDIKSGRLIRTLEGVGDDVWFVTITPDNSTVVTSKPGSISAWRLSTGQRVFLLEKLTVVAPICVFKGYNTVVLVTIFNQHIKLFDLHTGNQIKEIYDDMLPKESAMSLPVILCSLDDHNVLYTSRGTLSGVASSRSWIRAANLDTGKVEMKMQIGPGFTVQFIGVTAFDTLLLVMCEGEPDSRKGSAVQTKFFILELWNVSKKVLIRKLVDLSEKVRCYALSSDKSKALTLGNSRFLPNANVFRAELKAFDLESGDITAQMLTYPSTIHPVEFVDFNHVITASRDKIVRLWDLERNVSSPEDENDEEGEVEVVSVFGYQAICWEKNGVRLIDFQEGNFIQFINGIQPQVVCVSDSEVILVSSGKMYLFDMNERQFIHQFDGDTCQGGLPNSCFVYKQAQVIAISDDQRSLCVFDISDGKRIDQLECEHIRRLVHSQDGEICVSGHSVVNDDEARSWYSYSVWDMNEKTCIQRITLEELQADFSEMQLAADGNLLSDIVYNLATQLYSAVVYEMHTGRLLFKSKTEHHVHSFVIIAETRTLILGLFDGTMELYDVGKGTCVQRLKHAHLGAIHRIYTTNDGSVAMTTAGGLDSKDRSIRFWRLCKSKLTLFTVFTPDAKVSSMNLSGDGQLVALEVTEVVPFVLVRGTQREVNRFSDLDRFTCNYIVDLADLKVLHT